MPLPCPYGRLLQACPDGVSGLIATARRITQTAQMRYLEHAVNPFTDAPLLSSLLPMAACLDTLVLRERPVR